MRLTSSFLTWLNKAFHAFYWSCVIPGLPEQAQDERDLSQQRQYFDHGTLVVVKQAAHPIVDITKDPIQIRLNSIPSFDPIFLRKDKLAWSKEGEAARQRLDSESLVYIGQLIQAHFQKEAIIISKQQNNITKQIKVLDESVKHTFRGYTERQKAFAKHAESMNRIRDFAHLLAKVQAVLNDCRQKVELLNDMLPETEKLELPSLWADTQTISDTQKT